MLERGAEEGAPHPPAAGGGAALPQLPPAPPWVPAVRPRLSWERPPPCFSPRGLVPLGRDWPGGQGPASSWTCGGPRGLQDPPHPCFLGGGGGRMEGCALGTQPSPTAGPCTWGVGRRFRFPGSPIN